MAGKRLDDAKRLEIALAALKDEGQVAEVCNRYGISEATYYRLRDEAFKTLREGLKSGRRKGGREAALERENRELKELVADYAAAVHILKKSPLRR